MVTYQELTDLRLGKLHLAITAWEQTVQRMKKVTNGGGGGASARELEQKAQAADWKGQNATVTKEFVTKSAREFDDVLTSSRSVHNILNSAHADFKKHKETAEAIRKEAAPKNILVNDNGTVTSATPSPQVEGPDGKVHHPSQKEIDAVADKVKRLLWEAGETDRVAARALRTIAKDPYNFSNVSYDNIKDADKKQGVEDADAMTKLAAKKDNLSQEELQRFNTVLKNQRDNPAFAERFATKMGPDGTLQFWRSLADPGQDKTPEGERAKLLGRFQNNLSMTLATASHGDSPAMQQWKDGIIAAGPKEFGHEPSRIKPYGFQVMSNLMGKGKFDEGFLKDYGDKLYEFERENAKGPGNTETLWAGPQLGSAEPGHGAADLDHTRGGDYMGSDPMTGFLTAASHNPDYATELFNDDAKADYLLKDREYFSEADPNEGGDTDGPLHSREALGKALFAGGSGIDPDDPQGKFVEHSEGHRQVMDGALERLAGEKNDFPPELRDDMANLMGNHGDRVLSSMGEPLGSGPLNQDHLMEVTKQISRNQDAYGLLNENMNAAMVQDIHTKEGPDDSPRDSLIRSGRAVGFLEEARYRAVDDQKQDDLKDASWKGVWGYEAVATGSSFLPVGGGHVANAAFAASKWWVEDEQVRIDQEAALRNADTNILQQERLKALANEWYAENKGWADASENYSSDSGRYDEIGQLANAGKSDAEDAAGDG